MLLSAAAVGDLSTIKRLYDKNAKVDMINMADYDKRTALHLASSEGHESVVRFLLDEGNDVNCKDRWKGTPLVDALRGEHFECLVSNRY